MGCWVTPTVAAELWGVSLDSVMERVRAGSLPFKFEQDQLVVDLLARGAESPDVAATESAPPVIAVGPPQISPTDQAAPVVEPPAAPVRQRRPRSRRWDSKPATPSAARVAVAEPAGLVSDAELSALSAVPSRSDDEEMGPAGDPDPDLDGLYPEEAQPLHWQQVRSRVSRTRKPPGSF